MKTLHLTNSWHATSGGIATFYRNLMAEANRREQAIRLVVPGEHDRVEAVGAFGKIYHVKAPPALLNSAYRLIYPSQFLPRRSRLQQILASERPDLVEVCDKYTLNYLAGLLRKGLLRQLDFSPVVVGLSCERMDDNFRSYLGAIPLAQAFCSVYLRWLYFPMFDHHIANSEYTAAELRAVAEGHDVFRGISVRPMGVDLGHLSPQRRSHAVRRSLLRNFDARDDSVLLLYVGRLVPEKNLSLLFALFDHLVRTSSRDFRLLVVGDGIERGAWEKHCDEHLAGRARFLGHIKDADALADLYANCDIFVHPNPREPFGIAPLEAMASGLCLVAPDSGGVTAYASEDNAWVAPATVESFASAIHQALTQAPARAAKIEKALITAQAFRWPSVAASFLDLYEQLYRSLHGKVVFPPASVISPVAMGS